MFVVTEADAAAIRAIFEQRGEFAAAVELRRLFPGVADMTEARECARAIAAWEPLTVTPRPQAAAPEVGAACADYPLAWGEIGWQPCGGKSPTKTTGALQRSA